MNDFLIKNPELSIGFISILLTVISGLGGFALWYLIDLLRTARSQNGQIKRTNEKISELREFLNQNISKIYTSQTDFGGELIKIRRTLVSATVVMERRKAELDKIVGDSQRARGDLEKIRESVENQQKLLSAHNTEIIKLKNGMILVKGDKK